VDPVTWNTTSIRHLLDCETENCSELTQSQWKNEGIQA
jgi:hypothetical protein